MQFAIGVGLQEAESRRRASWHLIYLRNRQTQSNTAVDQTRPQAYGFGIDQHMGPAVRQAAERHAVSVLQSFFQSRRFLSGLQPAAQSITVYDVKIEAPLLFRGKGPWTVAITETALHALRKHQKSPLILEACVKTLERMEAGLWDQSICTSLNSQSTIPLFEAAPMQDSDVRILWQVEIGYCPIADSMRQVIRVWTVLDSKDDVENVLPKLVEMNGQLPESHIALSSRRNYPDEAEPRLCMPCADSLSEEDGVSECRFSAKEAEGMSYAAAFVKVFPMSELMVSDLLAGSNVPVLHGVSMSEARIINTRKSCIIKGRSGTGKTTCILFRMLAVLQATNACSDSRPVRQMFVTKSHFLCARVKRYFAQLNWSASDRTSEPCATATNETTDMDQELLLEDEDVPESLAGVHSHHFPLFCTFDQLFSMLEAALHREYRALPSPVFATQRISTLDKLHALQEVDFLRFDKVYWKEFDEVLRKRFESTLVWAEIQGLIKGSEEALSSCEGWLTKEQYEALNERRYPAFAHDRSRLYKLLSRSRKSVSSGMGQTECGNCCCFEKQCWTAVVMGLSILWMSFT